MLCIVREMSELEQKKAGTKRTELRADDIINSIGVGLYIYHLEDMDDREGRTLRLVSANQATADMTGVAVVDVVGKTIDENFPGLRAMGLPQIFAEVVRSGQPTTLEDVYYSDDRIVESIYATKLFPLSNQHVGVSFENITEQKKAEKKQHKDEELFHKVTELAHIGGWEVDLETMVQTFTDEAYELYEIPPGNSPSFEDGFLFYAPEARPIITAAVECAIGEGIPYDLELPFVTAKGNARWVRTLGQAEFVDGKATRLYGVIQDITERKRVEDALRKSEARLNSIVESVPDIIYRLDSNGKITFISGAVRGYGYAPEDLVGQDILDLVHPEEREKTQFRLNKRRIGDRRAAFFEIHLLTKDRSVDADMSPISPEKCPLLLVEAKGLYTEVEGETALFLGTQGIARDITERKKLEEAKMLTVSLQRVRHEIAEMKDEKDWKKIVGVLDEELCGWMPYYACGINILDLSKNTRMTYSVTNREAVKRHQEKNIAPVLHYALKEKRAVYRRNRADIEEWGDQALAKLNSVVDMPFSGGTLVVNSTKENAFEERHIRILEQFAVVVADGVLRLGDLMKVTAQDEQLRQAQKMEAIGQLTAGLAHNFNNLLQPIMTGLQLGKMEGPEELQAIFENAYVAAERSRDMVQQMMDLSRLNSSKQSEFCPLLLADILDKTISLCQEVMDRRIEIHAQFSKELPFVLGDANQLEQVFLNLCLNARDAVLSVERPARIEISSQAITLKGHEDEFVGRRSGDYICIEVKDNGIGMDAETQSRVFEPFFTTKEVGEGTGLGLATVFGIIQQHAGWIQCRSEIGLGTTFAVYLPVTEEVVTAPSPIEAQDLARGDETIFVVEDEESIRQAIRFMLEKQGYTVLMAEDGQQGLELFEQHRDRINLALLDLSLPRISGQELLVQLRGLSPSIRVLIMTGLRVDIADYEGAWGLVEKPFEMEDLLQVVRSALDGDMQTTLSL
ncbi:MAG: PAS domain S-box-containing protein [Candidatus Latescibacterota bacterium]|jgi:PAS domain S-box-containing protein